MDFAYYPLKSICPMLGYHVTSKQHFAYIGFKDAGGHLVWPDCFRELGFQAVALASAGSTSFLEQELVPIYYDLTKSAPPAEQVIQEMKDKGIQLEGVCFGGEVVLGFWQDLMSYLGRSKEWIQAYGDVSNKLTLRTKLFEAGLSNYPPLGVFEGNHWTQLHPLSYPCIAKPTFGGGSLLVRKCHSFQELHNLAQNIDWKRDFFPSFSKRDPQPKIFADTYIPGVEMDVDGYMIGDRIEIGACHEYVESFEDDVFLKGTNVSPPRFWSEAFQKELKEYLSSVFRLFGINREGLVFHVELKYQQEKRQFEIIEINPRIPGAYLHESVYHQTGVRIEAIQTQLSRSQFDPSLQKSLPSLRWNGTYAGSLHMYHTQSGKLKAIHGIDEALRIDGVKKFVPRYTAGATIPKFQGEVYSGFLVASGASRQDVLATMNRARQTIQFEFE